MSSSAEWDWDPEPDQQRKKLRTNLFSKLFFCWIVPIVYLGYRKDLEIDDVPRLEAKYRSKYLKNKLEESWNHELASAKTNNDNEPSLFRALWRSFGAQHLCIAGFGIINHAFIKIGQCLAFGYFLRFVNGEFSTNFGYCAAGAMVLLTGLFSVIFHQFMFYIQVWAYKLRVALCGLIYQKALRLSQRSLGGSSIGQITNFISNDVNRFDRNAVQLPYIFIAPVQLVVVTFVLWQYIGPSCLAGVALLIIVAPAQGYLAVWFGNLRRICAARTDLRVSLMNEIVHGILLIKMFTWEKSFALLVEKARAQEMQIMKRKTRLDFLNKGVFPVFGKLVVLVTLLAYVLTGNIIIASEIFVVLSLYDAIRMPICVMFPTAIMGWAEIFVTIHRIEKFLLLEEVEITPPDKTNFSDLGYSRSKHEFGICMEKFCAKWKSGAEYTLEDVDLDIGPGQFVAVVGPVGSGKSSLLYAILKELPPIFGKVELMGTLAYVGQDPWIFAGSIRDNILFGLGFNPIWYDQVIEACALTTDLAGFTYGDSTLIYDRGSNLSGGQKARINLARAVYSNAHIYLLDDPLSAVDVRAGRHIFENCILGLLKDKTVVLVTHQFQFLEPSHEIIVLNNGRVDTRGTVQELTNSGHWYNAESDEAEIIATNFEIDDDEVEITKSKPVLKAERRQRRHTLSHFDAEEEASEKEGTPAKELVNAKQYGTFKKQYEVREMRSSGLIGLNIYWHYFRSGNNCCLLINLLLFSIFTQIVFNGSDYWLKVWTNQENHGLHFGNTTLFHLNELDYLWVYCGIIGLLVIGSITRCQLLALTCTNSSVCLHKTLFESVLAAPMRFFELNSSGRVLNRFVNDVGVMDESLPQLAVTAIPVWFEILGSQIVVALMNPTTVLPGIIILILFYFIVKIYLRTSSSLKRLELIYRSPVIGHASTSLHGMPTIRAFGRIRAFESRYYTLQDQHSSTFYMCIASTRWLGVTLDWIAILYFICIVVGFFFIVADSGQVGLAISTALSMTTMFSWAANRSTDLGNELVSIERIIQYSNVQPEAPLEIPGKKPSAAWPVRGNIEFRRVCVQYGDNPPVLHSISCSIRGGEKIGIVGRTGAGKSSLIAVLFRIVEPVSGEILIDGLNVLDMGLHDLRSKIAIIPQNPLLFMGTMRRNLDPLSEHSDVELWKCLDQVHLADRMNRLSEAGLDSLISEGGSNFSQGEKQLICLARALLCDAKILVLDEATANMDSETDALIQQVVKEKFENSTILTIAHRLDTVMESDRILVLDKGAILEFGEPHVLLENGGRLYDLVTKTGPVGAAHLITIASNAYERRRKDQALKVFTWK